VAYVKLKLHMQPRYLRGTRRIATQNHHESLTLHLTPPLSMAPHGTTAGPPLQLMPMCITLTETRQGDLS
jgi:hypothetical protein